VKEAWPDNASGQDIPTEQLLGATRYDQFYFFCIYIKKKTGQNMEKLYLDVQAFITRMYSSPRPCIIGIKRLNLHARYHGMYF